MHMFNPNSISFINPILGRKRRKLSSGGLYWCPPLLVSERMGLINFLSNDAKHVIMQRMKEEVISLVV